MTKKIILLILIIISVFTTLTAQSEINNPKTKWKFKSEGSIRGSSVIKGNTIYFGSSDSFLYALDKKTGNLIWKTYVNGSIVGKPTITENVVLINNMKNQLYSIDIKSGNILWQFNMKNSIYDDFAGWNYFTADAVVHKGTIYIGSSDGNLYAINKNTGTPIWNYKTNGAIKATPLITDNTIYQPSNDGIIYVLNSKNGKLKWKFETAGANIDESKFGFDRNSIYTQPILKGNLLLFSSRDGYVYAIDIKTHLKKWSFTYGSTWAMSCTLENDLVYVGWSTNNLACAINLNTGKEEWKFQSRSHNYTNLVVAHNSLFMGSADGNLYSLDKKTGVKNWSYKIGTEIYSSPIFDHESNTIFFGADDGYFYALEDRKDAHKVVYTPNKIEGNNRFIVLDKEITSHLVQKGFMKIDSTQLNEFIHARISDNAPSVIVFTFPVIPKGIIGENPAKGLMRKYLESGGKVLWFGDIPNYFEQDANGGFKKNPALGAQLLDIEFTIVSQTGNHYSKSTQIGLNLGLPRWFKATCTPVSLKNGIIPLAYNEYNQVSAWMKKFNNRPGSGYISFRSWAYNVPIKDSDLELIYNLAIHELE